MPARVRVWRSLWGWIGLRRCWIEEAQTVAKVKRWLAQCQECVRSYDCMEASVYDSKCGDPVSRWWQSSGKGSCRAERTWLQDWDELGKEGPGSHSSEVPSLQSREGSKAARKILPAFQPGSPAWKGGRQPSPREAKGGCPVNSASTTRRGVVVLPTFRNCQGIRRKHCYFPPNPSLFQSGNRMSLTRVQDFWQHLTIFLSSVPWMLWKEHPLPCPLSMWDSPNLL